MEYREFIKKIEVNTDFKIIKTCYDEIAFGNAYILLKYKNVLTLRVVNDRGIIETEFESKRAFIKEYIPVKFAENVLNDTRNDELVYHSFEDVSKDVLQNNSLFDKLISKPNREDVIKGWCNFEDK